MKRILIVEDDLEISNLIAKYLKAEGFEIHSISDGNDAVNCANTEMFDLVILDQMLPGADGKEVLKAIRKNSKAPVIILSAKDSEADKIIGLELGADDYLTKPFTVGELTARVKAQLRRFTDFNDKAEGIGARIYDKDE